MVQHFNFVESDLKGVWQISPFIAQDERGLFIKDYAEDLFLLHGIAHPLKEVFYTYSKTGVIRALHFQSVKQQAKLVRCVSGKIFDVVVDLRIDSPTYGHWRSYLLTGENHLELYIPEHFAHGYLVLEDSIVSYKCSEKFYGEYDDGIFWNDPQLAIPWPVDQVEEVILSEKDLHLKSFKEYSMNLLKF